MIKASLDHCVKIQYYYLLISTTKTPTERSTKTYFLIKDTTCFGGQPGHVGYLINKYF